MSLAVSGYVKQFYKENTFGATEAGRRGHDTRSLLTADMQATRRALKALRSYDYSAKEDDDDIEELYRKMQAYVSTYNNYINSAKDLDHDDVDRSIKKIKKMTKERADDLAVIGIKMQNNGELQIDKDTMEKATKYKISLVFSGESDYEAQLEKYMKNIQTTVRRNNLGIPQQTTVTAAKDTTQSVEDAKLASKLAEALAGSQINEAI